MKKAGILIAVFVLVAALMTGCGCSGSVTTDPTPNSTTTNTTTRTTAATTAATTATRPSENNTTSKAPDNNDKDSGMRRGDDNMIPMR